MPKFPLAEWKPVTRYQSGSRHVAMNPRRLVFHTAVSSASSMHDFFNQDGQATPHFYVNGEGHAEQYIDTGYRGSANLDGNGDCIGVESWDNYPHGWSNGSDVPAWTDAQVEWLAQLAAWVNEKHGIPIARCPSSKPGTEGVGWHRLGIDGNFPSGLLAGRVSGGEHWSLSAGKVCPGDRRIQQIPSLIIPRALEISNGDTEDMPTVDDLLAAKISEDTTVKDALRAIMQVQGALSDFRTNERGRDAKGAERDKMMAADLDGIATDLDAIAAAVTDVATKEQIKRLRARLLAAEAEEAKEGG